MNVNCSKTMLACEKDFHPFSVLIKCNYLQVIKMIGQNANNKSVLIDVRKSMKSVIERKIKRKGGGGLIS